MSTDLNQALESLAAAAGRQAGEPPTARMLTRVRRRRTARTVTTSAVGVAAAAAVALTAVTVGDRGTGPDTPPATEAPVPDTTSSPAPDPVDPPTADRAPTAPADVPPWEAFPSTTLDWRTAPERPVAEVAAAVRLSVAFDGVEQLFLLDATDGTWVRSPWPTRLVHTVRDVSLAPDGRSLAHTRYDEALHTLRLQVVDPLHGATAVDVPVQSPDGTACQEAALDHAPDGTIALLATCGLSYDAPAPPRAVVLTVTPDGVVRVLADLGEGTASSATITWSPSGDDLTLRWEDDDVERARTVVLDAVTGDELPEPPAPADDPRWQVTPDGDAPRAAQDRDAFVVTDLRTGATTSWLRLTSPAMVGDLLLRSPTG